MNWCIPKKGDQARWLETEDGKPVFGPESPIATKATATPLMAISIRALRLDDPRQRRSRATTWRRSSSDDHDSHADHGHAP